METVAIRKSSGRRSAQEARQAAARHAPELAALDDQELLRIFAAQPVASERRAAACEILVSRRHALVRSCVSRFRNTPEPTEDLLQVGYVGLMKAINNFDPAAGDNLDAYAQRCITGEIKRHFRDKRWHAHVERPVQGLVLRFRAARAELLQQLGRTPTEAELARSLQVSVREIRIAAKAELALAPISLDAPLAGQSSVTRLADQLGDVDPQMELMLDWQAVTAHWGDLTSRDQRILLMRFYGDMTQAEIGQRLGISQMQVSRLLASALGRLRRRILDPGAGASLTRRDRASR